MSFPPPHLLWGAREVPSGRPRTFCGGRGGTRWPPPSLLWGGRGSTQWPSPCLLRGAGRYPVAAPAPSVGGSGGREGCREGAMERGTVTASLCWSQPHSQTLRDTSLSLGVCEWECDQRKLAVTIYLSIAPSLSPSAHPSPRAIAKGRQMPPPKGRNRALRANSVC